MNASQKKGLGLLISVLVFGGVAVCNAFGVAVPSWIDQVSTVLALVSGFFGVLVQNPFGPSK